MKCNPKTLVVCGTYTIGKEKIFLGTFVILALYLKYYIHVGIAEMLQTKVFVSKDKRGILDCLESADLSRILTTSDSNSRVHVLPMMKITIKVRVRVCCEEVVRAPAC